MNLTSILALAARLGALFAPLGPVLSPIAGAFLPLAIKFWPVLLTGVLFTFDLVTGKAIGLQATVAVLACLVVWREFSRPDDDDPWTPTPTPGPIDPWTPTPTPALPIRIIKGILGRIFKRT